MEHTQKEIEEVAELRNARECIEKIIRDLYKELSRIDAALNGLKGEGL